MFQYTSSFAQTNLVYNGDFELYDSCPASLSSPSDLEINRCSGWYSPTDSGTSDYYNVCNNSMSHLAGVPSNFNGYQYAYSGNGYCGFFTYAIDGQGRHYREYIQSKLIHKLEDGKLYDFSFFVAFINARYAVGKIGASFTDIAIHRFDYLPFTVVPQIVNTNGFITDTVNWTKIEGTFIANGNEEYITIGNFEAPSSTDTLNLDPSIYAFGVYGDLSYYYIDGVKLIEKEIAFSNVFTPNGDGKNDYFTIEFPFTTVSIYNRWGQKVFETKDNTNFWDGKTPNGENASDGTYYYLITIKEKTYKGFIQLLR